MKAGAAAGRLGRAQLAAHWALRRSDAADWSLDGVLRLLDAIERCGHIAGASRDCGMSYRHAWGLMREAEAMFEAPLILTSRRRGTVLTEFGQRLLWVNRRLQARLQPTLESLATELDAELSRLCAAPAALRLHASHGFAVEAMLQTADVASLALELRYRSAGEALAALAQGECELAGFQVPLGEFEPGMLAHYAGMLDPDRHVLIHLAVRQTGLFVRAGNPRGIRSVADLAGSGLRFVNRQPGSATRHFTELVLRAHGVDPRHLQGFGSSEFTHMAVAAHVASGMADAGVGVQTAAGRFGLDFLPLARERYFFALERETLALPSTQALLSLLRAPAFRAQVSSLDGYEAAELGQVQTLAQAFGPEALRQLAAAQRREVI